LKNNKPISILTRLKDEVISKVERKNTHTQTPQKSNNIKFKGNDNLQTNISSSS